MALKDDVLKLYLELYDLTTDITFISYDLLSDAVFTEFERRLFRAKIIYDKLEKRVPTAPDRLKRFTRAELEDVPYYFLVWIRDGDIYRGFDYEISPLFNLNLIEAVEFLGRVLKGVELNLRIKYARWKGIEERELIATIRDSKGYLFTYRVLENWDNKVYIETPTAWGDLPNSDFSYGAKFRTILFLKSVHIIPDGVDVNWRWRKYTDEEREAILERRGGVPLVRWRTRQRDYLNSIKVRKIRERGNKTLWLVDFSNALDEKGNPISLPTTLELRRIAREISQYGGDARIRPALITSRGVLQV